MAVPLRAWIALPLAAVAASGAAQKTLTTVDLVYPAAGRPTVRATVWVPDPLIPTTSGIANGGTVTFSIDGKDAGAVPVDRGVALLSLTQYGTHVVRAVYGGTADFLPSEGSAALTVKADVTLEVQPPGALYYGAPGALAITARTPYVPVLGGVEVREAGVLLGTAPLSINGAASYPLDRIPAGGHTLAFSYPGDANHNPAGAGMSFLVNPAFTLLRASAQAATYRYPQTVSIRCSTEVLSGGGVPAATIVLQEAGNTVAQGALDAQGVVTLTVPGLSPGIHTFTATHRDNTNYRIDPVQTVATVTAATRVSLSVATGPAAAQLTARVSADAPGAPGGVVSFFEGKTLLGAATLGPGGSAQLGLANQASGLHVFAASYRGDGVYEASDSPAVEARIEAPAPKTAALTSLSSASGAARIAPGSIVSGYLSSAIMERIEIASDPTNTFTLGGISVAVNDSAGVTRPARLFFAGPTQVNYLMPAETAPGTANVTVSGPGGTLATGTASVLAVAPGLYSGNGTGAGPAAAIAIQVAPDGSQHALVTFQCSGTVCLPIPLDLGAGQTVLELFGTGIRNRAAEAGVTATIGGAPATVLYSGPQGDAAGLDQVNVAVPAQLAGRGEVSIVLTVDGAQANPVTVRIQ